MTVRHREGSASRRRPRDCADMARPSPLPPPDEVFVDWLMSVPHDANLEVAARKQIEIIDAHPSPHLDVQCLRLLLVAVVGASHWRPPVANL